MTALAGVAQCIKPVNERVAGSIPSQGTCLSGRFGGDMGAYNRQPIDVSHISVSLLLHLPPFPSL